MQNFVLLVLLLRANQCWLAEQYNCLEFKNFAKILLLKMLSIWCQTNHCHFKFHCYWRFYIWKNLIMVFRIFFLLDMCARRIKTFFVPVHFLFIQEILKESFVLKKSVSSYSFMKAALTMRFRGI